MEQPKTLVLTDVFEEENTWCGETGGYFCMIPKTHWICEYIDKDGTGVFTAKTGQREAV